MHVNDPGRPRQDALLARLAGDDAVQITLHTDYTIRTLIYLGTQPDRLVTVAEIARAYGISRNHLVKVVHALAGAGYVETVRGKHGGVRLKADPESVCLGTLVRRGEPLRLLECFDRETDRCPITSACAVKGALWRAQEAFLEVLDGYTLADMLQDAPRLGRLLTLEAPRRPAPDAA
jgi:Rrf2 family transcriptional regulator, nitric oxide-sensitive transcriptional repressor